MKTLIFTILATGSLLAQQLTVMGTLTGHDGKPMPMAHVHLGRDGQSSFLSVQADARGSFTLTTGETGMLWLQYTGVDHQQYSHPILVTGPQTVRLDVRLAAYPYKEVLDKVQIIGDFNNFSFSNPKEMTRQPDGTFVAEFETTQPKFSYQIVGVLETVRSINGTQSEEFAYDGGGDYRSIVTPKNGRVKIVFSPSKLKRSNAQAVVSVVEGDPAVKQLLDASSSILAKREEFSRAAMAFQKSGKDMKDFSFDDSAGLSRLADSIKREKLEFARRLLLLQYVSLAGMSSHGRDSTIVRRALDEIPVDSWLWSVAPGLFSRAAYLAGASVNPDSLMEVFVAKNPDASAKPAILFNMLMNAYFQKKQDRFAQLYSVLTTEYGDTPQGKMVKSRFSPDSKIAVGRKAPSFALPSLDDPQKIISDSLFQGKTTLIDFWAVWCGPCIAEMENLHKAYERFKSRGFQIISLSFDEKPSDVVEFRKKKWKMPWLHAFVEQGFDSGLAKAYEVIGIPKPILVDAQGTILATDVDLRGSNLEKTLAKVLGE